MALNEWDDIYRKYPLSRIPWHTKKPEPLLVKLVDEGKIKSGTVLDMCSGAGTNSIYLATKGFDVYGVDISPKAVEIAKQRCEDLGVSCRYFSGDVLKKRFNKRFDFVFDRGCFHHIENTEKPAYVKRVHSLLNHNGKFFLQCFSDKNKGFWKSLSKQDIYTYFSGLFEIEFIKEIVHHEPDGNKVSLYTVFMAKKQID